MREQVELLKSSPESTSTDPSVRDQRADYLSPPPTLASNGYDELGAASQDARRAIASKSQQPETYFHPDLRAGPAPAPTANMMPIAPPAGHSPASSSGPSNAALAPAPAPPSSAEDPTGEGRKVNKRELSQSKRAAQNRAAQVRHLSRSPLVLMCFRSAHAGYQHPGRTATNAPGRGHFANERRPISSNSRRKLGITEKWRSSIRLPRQRTTSCGNT